jgi:hypothetical protein
MLSLGLYFWTDAMIPQAYRMREQLARRVLESLSSIGMSEGTFIEKFPDWSFMPSSTKCRPIPSAG